MIEQHHIALTIRLPGADIANRDDQIEQTREIAFTQLCALLQPGLSYAIRTTETLQSADHAFDPRDREFTITIAIECIADTLLLAP